MKIVIALHGKKRKPFFYPPYFLWAAQLNISPCSR